MAWARTFDIPAMTAAWSVALTIGGMSLSSFFAGGAEAAAAGLVDIVRCWRRFLLLKGLVGW